MHPLEPFSLPIEYRRTGFGKRFVAALIDALLTIVLSIGIAILLHSMGVSISVLDSDDVQQITDIYRMLGVDRDATATALGIVGVMSISSMVINVLYSLLELFTGTSIGKMSLGLVIAHPDGRRGTLRLWATRWLLKNLNVFLGILALIPSLAMLGPISTIIGILFIIGCFFALGEARLALHDRIAQTAVFHKDDIQ